MSNLDSRLYNPEVAAAFRAEAKQRTRALTAQRRFLLLVARALAGKLPAFREGITRSEGCVRLEDGKTQQYWPLVEEICDAIPAIRWFPTDYRYLGIFAAPLPEA